MTSASEATEASAADPSTRSDTQASPSRRLLAPLTRHEHLLFGVLLLAGAVLRWVTWRAYWPALLFPDSHTYLKEAHKLQFGFYQPSGYPVFLWPLVRLHHPSVIALVQHLLGLGIAVLLYLVLRRRGVPSWGAALATIPVLFDPLQLILEQYVLSDVLFEALVSGSIALFLWRRRPDLIALSAAGLLLGLATVTRNAGMFLVLAGLVAAVALGSRLRAVAGFVAGFLLVVGGYVVGHHAVVGTYAITDTGGRYLYARLASSIVDCPTLKLPAYERGLCPTEPLHHRPSIDHYMWSYHSSPQYHVKPPPGQTQDQMIRDFDRRVIRQQPFAYARVIGYDFLRGFQWNRTVRSNDIRFVPFQFQKRYPTRWVHRHLTDMEQLLGVSTVKDDRGKASFLVSYERHFHVPGPFFAACLLLALLAVFGVGRSKRSGLRTGTLLYAGSALLVLVPSAMAVGLSWRYQLVQFVLLPPAAALALTALVRRPAAVGPDEPGTDLAVDRLAGWLLHLPLPGRARRVLESGHAHRLVRYALGSIICTTVSAVLFVVLFATALMGSRGASLTASAVAAVIGYWLNRRWTWGRRRRPDLRRELLPYWATIVVTAVLAALVTGAVNGVLRGSGVSRGIRTAVDLVAYLGTYGVLFTAKYLLFHRMFTSRTEVAPSSSEPAQEEPASTP